MYLHEHVARHVYTQQKIPLLGCHNRDPHDLHIHDLQNLISHALPSLLAILFLMYCYTNLDVHVG